MGPNRPAAKQAGHDFNYAALTGALWYASGAGDRPKPANGCGRYWWRRALSGDWDADRDIACAGYGQGCVVDAAIVDGAAHMMNLLMSLQSNNSLSEARVKPADGPHWSRCYACADGAYMSVQCLEPKFYAQFLNILGLQDTEALLSSITQNYGRISRAHLPRFLPQNPSRIGRNCLRDQMPVSPPFIPHGRRKMTRTFRTAASGKRWMACFARPPHRDLMVRSRALGIFANAMHIALKF